MNKWAMAEFNALSEYEALLSRFSKLIEMAEDLESPNPEDDLCVKAAIIGFSHHARTEQWGQNHLDHITRKRKVEFSDQELGAYGIEVRRVRLFVCLCLGSILGLHQAGRISENQFHIAEAQLPGFIVLRLEDIGR